jgi:hypothetical protein
MKRIYQSLAASEACLFSSEISELAGEPII